MKSLQSHLNTCPPGTTCNRLPSSRLPTPGTCLHDSSCTSSYPPNLSTSPPGIVCNRMPTDCPSTPGRYPLDNYCMQSIPWTRSISHIGIYHNPMRHCCPRCQQTCLHRNPGIHQKKMPRPAQSISLPRIQYNLPPHHCLVPGCIYQQRNYGKRWRQLWQNTCPACTSRLAQEALLHT